MKKASLVLALIMILAMIFVGCGLKKVTDNNLQIENKVKTAEPTKIVQDKPVSDSEIDFKNIKVGDKIGELIVNKVDLKSDASNNYNGYIKFSGEVTIEGEYERMTSTTNPITVIIMSLDEDSKKKLPARIIKEDNKAYVYLPYSGQFGNKGMAKLVINEFQVNVGGEESWPNEAKISKVIEVNKEFVANSANTPKSSMAVSAITTPIIQPSTPVYSSTPIPTNTPERSVLPSDAITLKGKVVSSSKIDYDNDGIKETLQIVLKNGYFTEDKEQWSGNGPKWVGLFTIDVLEDKKEVSSQSLNKLVGSEDTIFLYSPAFELAFGDYNADGQPDFTITQYFSTNGSEIYLFTVGKDGQIQKLNIENRYAFFESPHLMDNSIPLDFNKNQIKFWYYDNTQGAYFTDYYGWDAQRKLFIRLKQEKTIN